jgi:hypothetical protein
MNQLAYFEVDDVNIKGFGTGIYASNFLSSHIQRATLSFNNNGFRFERNAGATPNSSPNAITMIGCTVGNNYFYGGFPNSTFPASMIFDVIDYASTSKFKTIRAIAGMDNNGATAPYIALGSGLWRSTSAVTSISFSGVTGTFSLYGIKGA